MKYSATPAGVCSRRMDFEIDENGIVTKVLIVGGCPGNSLGLAKLAEGRKAEDVVALLSGGNIDVTILARVINRGLVTSGRRSELNLELLDRPGELTRVSSIISSQGANVVNVNHTRGNVHNDINACFLQITMETRDFAHFEQICAVLRESGYTVNI